MTLKQTALRHAGVCRVCRLELPAKTTAVYDFDAKNVLCLACRGNEPAAQQEPKPPTAHAPATQRSPREHDRRVGDRRRTLDPTEPSRGRGGSVLQRDS